MIMTLSLTSSCSASDKLYAMSIGTLAAGNLIDAQSSYGRFELNPVLASADGRFGGRAIVFKGLINAGILAAERYGINRLPHGRRISTIINFAIGGSMIGVGIQNHRGGF